jgi:hypothetical protein
VDAALEAVARGTVERLYLLRDFVETGMICSACAAVQHGAAVACRWCGKPARMVDLAEAMMQQVLASGGTVETVRTHAGLARAGGVTARLRYVPSRAV